MLTPSLRVTHQVESDSELTRRNNSYSKGQNQDRTFESVVGYSCYQLDNFEQRDEANQWLACPPYMTDQQLITVLIIDDDADDRFFMEQAFQTNSAPVRLCCAEGGEEALDMLVLLHPAPDVILLDLNMPGMGGFAVLRYIKQSTHHQAIPVIVLTTSDATDDREQAYDLGASGFITKPTTHRGLCEIADRIRRDNSRQGL